MKFTTRITDKNYFWLETVRKNFKKLNINVLFKVESNSRIRYILEVTTVVKAKKKMLNLKPLLR